MQLVPKIINTVLLCASKAYLQLFDTNSYINIIILCSPRLFKNNLTICHNFRNRPLQPLRNIQKFFLSIPPLLLHNHHQTSCQHSTVSHHLPYTEYRFLSIALRVLFLPMLYNELSPRCHSL